jgi:hypothetical protein
VPNDDDDDVCKDKEIHNAEFRQPVMKFAFYDGI